METAAAPARLPLSCWGAGLPHQSRPTRPSYHPPLLLILLPASSQESRQLDTFSEFSGHCCFLLKFLAPRPPPCAGPIPAMGKVCCLVDTAPSGEAAPSAGGEGAAG